MEEGLFTLVFIVLLILMSIMDAVGRRRQKERQMEEMDEEGVEVEEPGRVGRGASPEAGRPPWQEETRSRAEDARSGAPTADYAPPGADEGDRAAKERETADQMVPEDFWAILTGETPPSREPSSGEPAGGTARREAEQTDWETEEEPRLRTPDEMGRRGDPSPPKDPHIPMPLPGERRSAARREEVRRIEAEEAARAEAARRRAEEAARAPTRRSARWMEGVEGRTEPDRTVEPIEAQEAAIYGAPKEPWGELGDIAAGDLTASGADGAEAGRRGRGRGAYTGLVESGSVEDLRKAIVLREVLGPPVGFRDDAERGW